MRPEKLVEALREALRDGSTNVQALISLAELYNSLGIVRGSTQGPIINGKRFDHCLQQVEALLGPSSNAEGSLDERASS